MKKIMQYLKDRKERKLRERAIKLAALFFNSQCRDTPGEVVSELHRFLTTGSIWKKEE